MSSAIAILEHLLDDESLNSKEHIIETASPKLSNVEGRLQQTFDTMVRDISTIWGDPQFNNRITSNEEDKVGNVVPTWSKGTARSGGEPMVLRLAYWKRPGLTCYVQLRTELDKTKDPASPMFYDLVFGSRRRSPDKTQSVQNMKQVETNKMTELTKAANGLVRWLSGR